MIPLNHYRQRLASVEQASVVASRLNRWEALLTLARERELLEADIKFMEGIRE